LEQPSVREFSAIDFPVAVDQLTTGAALATPENTEALTETIPDLPAQIRASSTASKVNAAAHAKHQQPLII